MTYSEMRTRKSIPLVSRTIRYSVNIVEYSDKLFTYLSNASRDKCLFGARFRA